MAKSAAAIPQTRMIKVHPQPNRVGQGRVRWALGVGAHEVRKSGVCGFPEFLPVIRVTVQSFRSELAKPDDFTTHFKNFPIGNRVDETSRKTAFDCAREDF
ncbi:MAG: hypothetical protein KDB14_03230 [Planctomycetales bacterium]|nr:hypothetical protein [Planctomycetales bacterium]